MPEKHPFNSLKVHMCPNIICCNLYSVCHDVCTTCTLHTYIYKLPKSVLNGYIEKNNCEETEKHKEDKMSQVKNPVLEMGQ